MNLKPHTYPKDIYTEGDADSNTIAHLGPLAALAGIWQGDESRRPGRFRLYRARGNAAD